MLAVPTRVFRTGARHHCLQQVQGEKAVHELRTEDFAEPEPIRLEVRRLPTPCLREVQCPAGQAVVREQRGPF